MVGEFGPLELGVVAIVLLLVLKEVLKFLKDVAMPKIFGTSTGDSERIRQEAINDVTLQKLASAMEKQTSILQKIELLLSEHTKDFRELAQEFREHDRLFNKN